MVSEYPTSVGKVPTHVYIVATDSYGTNIVVRTATQSRPTAGNSVPFSYIVGTYPTCKGEATTNVYIAAVGSYCGDIRIRSAYTPTQARPPAGGDFPPLYAGCAYSSCFGEVS